MDGWQSKLGISAKGLIIISVPLLLNFVSLGGLWILLEQQNREVAKETRLRIFCEQAPILQSSIIDSFFCAFSTAMSHDRSGLQKLLKIKTRAEKVFSTLNQLERGSAKNLAKLDFLNKLYKRLSTLLEAVCRMAAEGKKSGLLTIRQTTMSDDLQIITGVFVTELQDLIQEEKLRQSRQHSVIAGIEQSLKLGIFSIAFANLILSTWIAITFGRNISSRLKVLIENVHRMKDGKEDPLPISGTDEIAHLDRTYRDMAMTISENTRKERALVENAKEIICSLDKDGIILSMNQASLLVLGKEPQDLVGKPICELILDDEFAEYFRNSPEDYAKRFESSTAGTNGERICLLWSNYWSSQQKTFFCVAYDVSLLKEAEQALKESEARVRAIIERISVGIAILNESGAVKFSNPVLAEMLGFSPAEMQQKHINQFVQENKQNSISQTFLSESLQSIKSAVCINSAAKPVPVEIASARLQHREENEYVTVFVNISDRLKIEAARQELVDMVSHDLRTPLQSVKLTLDMLASSGFGEIDENYKKATEKCEFELWRLLSVINGLLDLEKIMAGMLKLERNVFKLSEILNKAKNAVVSQTKGTDLQIEWDKESQYDVLCDGERITQVFTHLLTAAAKSAEKGATVHIDVEEEEQSIRFQISVEDAGTGQPGTLQRTPELNEYDSEISMHMFICSGIVSAHGGQLSYSGESNNSYEFWIPLPC